MFRIPRVLKESLNNHNGFIFIMFYDIPVEDLFSFLLDCRGKDDYDRGTDKLIFERIFEEVYELPLSTGTLSGGYFPHYQLLRIPETKSNSGLQNLDLRDAKAHIIKLSNLPDDPMVQIFWNKYYGGKLFDQSIFFTYKVRSRTVTSENLDLVIFRSTISQIKPERLPWHLNSIISRPKSRRKVPYDAFFTYVNMTKKGQEIVEKDPRGLELVEI